MTPNEIQLFYGEYNASTYTTKKLLYDDPTSRYFNLKKGDVIRLIRPSPTAGEGIDYRVVF